MAGDLRPGGDVARTNKDNKTRVVAVRDDEDEGAADVLTDVEERRRAGNV